MKHILLITILFLALAANSQTGSIRGIVTDESTLAVVPFATVSLHKLNGILIHSVQANIDGVYNFTDVIKGKYILKFNSMQYTETKIAEVHVLDGKMTMQKAYLSLLKP